MNLNQNPLPSESQRTSNVWLIGVIPSLLFAGLELAALWVVGYGVWAVLPVLPVFAAIPIAYRLFRAQRRTLASIILMITVGLQAVFVPLLQSGSGVPNAITALALIVAIGLGTLAGKHMPRILVTGMVFAIIAILVDTFGWSNRPAALFTEGRWALSVMMLVLLGVFIARQLFLLDIRTKIVTGILGTGALALAVFIIFSFTQTGQITNTLSARLEKSVSDLAEERLKNAATTQANQANHSFEEAIIQVESLAQNWSALNSQKEVISRRSYWDATTNLTQLTGGQYGNSSTAISSIFIPKGIEITDSLVIDLNTSAYLDFYAPASMKVNPLLLAIYAVDTRGIIRRYPNNNLASTLEPDFDATKESYYVVAAPLRNSKRLSRWIIPDTDLKSGELFVRVASPVYDGDRFIGVIVANMQLAGIAEQVNSIKIGKTGYAYMIDGAGHIISMPQAGFDMFGVHGENLSTKEFYQRSIEDSGTLELKSLTKRMTAGGRGLAIVDVNGIPTYISYAPISTNGYSVALVVPVAEMQTEIIAAREETNQQSQTAVRTAIIILIILFVSAITVSFGLGRIIAAPIQRLTQAATQVAAGDLSVQAATTARDEIGILGQSFNIMTARLRETLDGLEHMVHERTSELLLANEGNERRARQFESIAQVARTISSTRDLDTLLGLITTVISREFGFYHVGIFLLDTAREYAILSAANSEGGKAMIKRGHRLKVGEMGIVGYVTGTGTPRVALDTGADAVFFNSPDLPETRSEIALPLRSGDEIIGALDVQSIESAAFSQEDINILSTLADQVSVAIQNARQFEETRKALREAEALAKQFAKAGWQQYTRDKNLVGIHHTGAKATLLYDRSGDKEKEETPRNVASSQAKSRGTRLSLPIELRGEVIGSVDVRSPDSHPWDQDELDIITAIIERSAVAMENARLLEESQRLASKESKISAVTAKIGASINMRNVLQTAVEELGRALPGSEVVIQFQTDENKTTS